MKIVFMGTPDFAVNSLQALIDDKQEIVGVFTQPDKPKGRGHKLAFPPVKELAISNNLTVFQPKTLKTGEAEEIIRSLEPEMIIVAAYGKILPRSILDIPKRGCINLHGSLLPKYRGAAPIQWSVLNGDKITGVTTMLMAEGMDTGDMLLKAETQIGENETAGELFERLATLGAELLIRTVHEAENGKLNPIPQNDDEATLAPPLSKEMTAIDFTQNATAVHNKIRGLSDWPCAVTALRGKRLKVYQSEIVTGLESENVGFIADEKTFVVYCGENTAIKLISVQYDGSKRMNGADFLRGQRIEKGEEMK